MESASESDIGERAVPALAALAVRTTFACGKVYALPLLAAAC